MKTTATILLFGLMLVPFGAEAQTKPATNLDQANQMIVLLQKQLLVLQQQLSEMKESNKKSSKTVYYASLSTEWNTKEAKSCYAITIAEDDGTAAIDEKISIVVVDKNTAVASLRKGKTFTLKTDEFGKATHCGNATKITVKKGGLLKQDKAFSTDGMIETAVASKTASCQATYKAEIASTTSLYDSKIEGIHETSGQYLGSTATTRWLAQQQTEIRKRLATLEQEKKAEIQRITKALDACTSL